MKLGRKEWIGMGIGLLILIIALALFRGETLFYFLIVIGVIVASLPFVLSLLSTQGVEREKEEQFLAFSRDLVENVKSGTPISKSIINLRNRNYGSLSIHVEKLANQLGLGLTLRSAFRNFAKDSGSKVISRAVALISEAERAGGQIETVLDSVAKSVNQTEVLRKERKASISNLITQGYLIFFIFIIIMLVLEFKILPLVSDLSSTEGLTAKATNLDPSQFSMPLFVMLLVQSFFAGLVIGKISEGSVSKGIKHSFILLAVTLLVTTGARALFLFGATYLNLGFPI